VVAWAARDEEAVRGPPRTLAEDVAAPRGGEERRRGRGVTGAEENSLPFPGRVYYVLLSIPVLFCNNNGLISGFLWHCL
jgi:hypothetical protein